ncbi:hypothetical protein SEUCBS140593_005490 [Sporothrix eucalyptigena]|uniref:Xylanolytic transcriptional activator regulatory domain-containing protein n=1 Tax=Sporothrix eucalyptigena TaxID=1812306 RepID=A0ABP0BX07_9PEZI
MTPASRVVRACVRCRKQKLRVSQYHRKHLNSNANVQCDAVRPCTLCQRSGVVCEPRDDPSPTPPKPPRKKRRLAAPPQPPPPLADASPPEPVHQSPVETLRSPAVVSVVSQVSHGTGGSPSSTTDRQHYGANSSAVGFAAHLFGDSAAAYASDIASIPGHAGRPPEKARGRSMGMGLPTAQESSAPWSLVTMVAPPPITVVETLLDAYFDRMHWFINIFHEPTLRRTARQVLSNRQWPRSALGAVLASLAVSAMGLQCVVSDPTWPGHAVLREAGLEAATLREALIQEVRIHLLDLLDDCCMETVQVTSLLGTYYMFHASPTLAWSILGLSVRTAYALALHADSGDGLSGDGDNDFDPIMAQVRRRNWNHITVSDTFAAMIYGRPASLDAAFSHVQPLQDLDDTRLGPGLSSHPLIATSSPSSTSSPPVTLLTFHVLKFRLYGIIRQALNRFRLLRLQNPIAPDDLASLVQAVQHARTQLDAWRAELPPLFAINDDADADATRLAEMPGLSPDEQGARRRLLLQVPTLHATFDSAVIFVHRPLLAYRVSVSALTTQEVLAQALDLSVHAALRMSHVPVARLERQFVVAFVLMNLFTAGVILCIPPTTWPLSAIAHQAKAGTMRIIRASRSLKGVSHIAMHTETLLTRLLKRSLQQELENGLQELDEDDDELTSNGRGRPAMGYYYTEPRQQVVSQLDEAFGTFGQVFFNLVPDDPYSAWNWGNGGL